MLKPTAPNILLRPLSLTTSFLGNFLGAGGSAVLDMLVGVAGFGPATPLVPNEALDGHDCCDGNSEARNDCILVAG
jgi:hypothetical protein